MDLDVIGGILRMRPSEDGIGGGVQDFLGVGTGEVGREGDVEGVGDGGVGSLRVDEGRARMRDIFWMGVDWVAGHVGTATHSKVGTHPLGPVPHICQFVHGEQMRV